MGNQQSTPPLQPQRRLSKPKTNSSQSNVRLLLSASQVVEPSALPERLTVDPSVGEVEMVAIGAPGDRGSLQGALQKLRDHSWSFGGNDSMDTFKDEDTAAGSLGAIVSGVKDRISRSGSINSRHMSGARNSLTRLASRGGSPRMSLIADPIVSGIEETALMRQEIEETVRANELTALQHISSQSPTTEYSSNGTPCTPIRRKSLLTPGIATRGRPINILRKAPPPEELQTQADRDYYFSSSLPCPSPLARRGSWDIGEQGRPSPGSRASTPCDLEFGVLGVFKRGTLRITNGAASPERTSRDFSRDPPSPTSRHSEEYFTASEGRRSPEMECTSGSKQVKMRESGELVDGSDPLLKDDSEFDRIARPLRISTSGGHQRCGSPSKFQRLQDDMDFCEEPIEIATDLPPSPDLTSAIAQEYIKELPDSPFLPADDELESPTSGTTSRSDASGAGVLEDEGVVVTPFAETQSICNSTHLVQQWRSGEHAFNCTTCYTNTHRLLTAALPATSESPSSSEDSRRESMVSRSLSKADSGYGSQRSVKSLIGGSGAARQESGSSSYSGSSVSLTSSVTNSPKLWLEQGLEVTHEHPLRRRSDATRSKEIVSASLPREISPVLRPSILPPTATNAEDTTVVVIPPPKSKWRTRKSLPAEILQQPPLRRKGCQMLQPPPRVSSLGATVQTYRKIAQAHIPPQAPTEVESKRIQRVSKHPPPTPFGSRDTFEPSNAEGRPSWHSLAGHCSFVTNPGDLRQRSQSTSIFSNEEEAVGFAHERRTRSRSQGQDPPVGDHKGRADSPGITNQPRSVYMSQPSTNLTPPSKKEPGRKSIASKTYPHRCNTHSDPMHSSTKSSTSSEANITPDNEATQTSESQRMEKWGYVAMDNGHGERAQEPYYGHGALTKRGPETWGSNDLPISVNA